MCSVNNDQQTSPTTRTGGGRHTRLVFAWTRVLGKYSVHHLQVWSAGMKGWNLWRGDDEYASNANGYDRMHNRFISLRQEPMRQEPGIKQRIPATWYRVVA